MDDKPEEFFLSFTNLCFIFMAFYFLVAIILSYRDWRKKRNAFFVSVPGANSTTESLLFGGDTLLDDDEAEQEEGASLGHKIFWVMFEVAFTVAVFVDFVFWTALYTGSLDLFVVALHALNGIFMIVELFLNSMVFIPGHVIFVWFLMLLYVIEVLVWRFVGNVWAYPFLDYGNKLAFVYYPTLFVTVTITFFFGVPSGEAARPHQARKQRAAVGPS